MLSYTFYLSIHRACNTLRCTSCDFRVIWFNDYCWHSSCDYLFFRNNVPEYDKLRIKLMWNKGIYMYISIHTIYLSIHPSIDYSHHLSIYISIYLSIQSVFTSSIYIQETEPMLVNALGSQLPALYLSQIYQV